MNKLQMRLERKFSWQLADEIRTLLKTHLLADQDLEILANKARIIKQIDGAGQVIGTLIEDILED